MRTHFRFWPVFRRNLLVWRKLVIPSLVANITAASFVPSADPAMSYQFRPLSRAVHVAPAAPVVPAGITKLGASFTAAKVIVTVAAAEERPPSEAITVKVIAPFSFEAGT